MNNDETRIISSFLYVRSLVSEDSVITDIKQRAEQVCESLHKLIGDLELLDDDAASEEQIQSVFFESGKLHFSSELRWWFQLLYQIFLKQSDGPRLGQLTKLMTIYWIIDKIKITLNDPWAAMA